MQLRTRYNQGLTLIEILVAILVLSVAIIGGLTLLTFNLRTAKAVENNLIASLLVQEGVEVVRNLRDTDWFGSNDYGELTLGGGGSPFPDGTYRVQWDSTTLIPLGANPPLRHDSSTGTYSYDVGPDTLFRRTLDLHILSPGGNPDVLRIVVTVEWEERGFTKNVSAETHLHNWFSL